MIDKHLNLFYSYNRDNQLIENNLTRAWIVTLRMISGETRNLLLRNLFKHSLQKLGEPLPTFIQAQFGLQGNFDTRLLSDIPHRYVVTIATERDMEVEPSFFKDIDLGHSIPDAWIFDPEEGYCFLVEAKIGNNPLDAEQVYSHAEGWLGITKENVQEHLVAVTWHDVLTGIENVGTDVVSQQDFQLLQEITQYLGFFGYRVYKGFDFSDLQAAPTFSLTYQ